MKGLLSKRPAEFLKDRLNLIRLLSYLMGKDVMPEEAL